MVHLSKLFYGYFVICLLDTYASTLDVSQLTLEEIDSMFGKDECIEGLLYSMPHATELPQSYATLQSNTISKVINEKENKEKDSLHSLSDALGTYASNNIFSINMTTNLLNSSGKSPMSLVNELAIFNKIHYEYELTNEDGPAHKKIFTVTLKLGDEEYSADGTSVKKAKHSAASKALHQTDYKHPPLKASRNKGIGKSNCGFNGDQNGGSKSPISLVHEIATKRNLLVSFEIDSEDGPPHMRTFVTKCTVGDKTTTGQGNGKQLSKKIAAERMLEELKTHTQSSSLNLDSCTKRRKRKTSKGKKRFQKFIRLIKKTIFGESGSTKGSYAHQFEPENNAAIDYKRNGHSKFSEARTRTADSFNNMKKSVPQSDLKQSLSLNQAQKPKDHLKYLGQLRDFEVHFTDFKKGNHSEILTLVSLTTDPPQVCLGSGFTTEASHNQASRAALTVLSKIGFDSMVPTVIDNKKEIEAQRYRIHLAELSFKKSGGLSFQK